MDMKELNNMSAADLKVEEKRLRKDLARVKTALKNKVDPA
jgi:ribosomal protein L29